MTAAAAPAASAPGAHAGSRHERPQALLPSVLLVAFVFSPRLVGPVRLGDLLVVAALPLLLPRLAALRRRSLTRPERLYLLFLLWSALTTTWSLATGINQRGLAATLGAARIAEIGLLYLAAHGGNAADRRRLRAVAAVSLLILAGVGLIEFLDAYLRAGEHFVRVYNRGFFAGEANHVAGAAVILAAAAPAFIPVALGVAALAGARTALLVAAVLALRDWIVTRRHRRAALTGALFALFLVLAPEAHRLRFTTLPTGGGTYAGPHVERLIAWSVALRETPPLTGVGFGARPSSVYESAYVHLYAETGLPGLLLWLGILAALVFPARGAARHAPLGLALLGLGLTANVAIIARIAGPAALLVGAECRERPLREDGSAAK